MPIPALVYELDAGDAVRALRDAIDEHLRRAVVEIADNIAHTAQQTHPWQNRTGTLQAETQGDNVVWGDLWDGTLEGAVVARTNYASFLEDNPQWEWLGPAWEANEPFAEDDLERALGRACSEAGW